MAIAEIVYVCGRELPLAAILESLSADAVGCGPVLFLCLAEVIDALGSAFCQFVDVVFERVRPWLEFEFAEVRVNSALVIAKMCAVCGLKGDMLRVAINCAMREFTAVRTFEGRTVIGEALKFMVLTDSEELRPRVEFLVAVAREVLHCGYWGLNAAMGMKYEFFEEIGEVLDLLPPPRDSREIAFCADFVSYLVGRGFEMQSDLVVRVGVALFWSSESTCGSSEGKL
jgi:hypothetical protein